MRSSSIILLVLWLFAGRPTTAVAEVRESATGSFVISQQTTVPVDPEAAYDLLSGDISPWWDHRFQPGGGRFFIEARPGGGFYEYFDEAGNNGVLHATVIWAERGKRLSFEGPLGLNGTAVQFVVTYTLEAVEGGTAVAVECHGSGEVEEGLPEIVDSVWHHFLIERYQPYVESLVESE